MAGIRRINSRGELMALARQLNVRPDWHEPDEQEVGASVGGHSFDNAGFWGADTETEWRQRHGNTDGVELYVQLTKDGEPVAEVNLATLFAWATGHEAEAQPVIPEARAAATTAARALDQLSTDLRNRASDLRDLADTI